MNKEELLNYLCSMKDKIDFMDSLYEDKKLESNHITDIKYILTTEYNIKLAEYNTKK